MLKPGSPGAIMLGRWGMALALVIGAVLVGRVMRAFPYLLPNRMPGLVLYELGPGLTLALAIGAAITVTRDSSPRLGMTARLALFTLAAIISGIAVLGWEFASSLRGQWL